MLTRSVHDPLIVGKQHILLQEGQTEHSARGHSHLHKYLGNVLDRLHTLGFHFGQDQN